MSTITWFLVYALVGFLTGSFVDAHRNNNVLKWPKRVENGVDLGFLVTAFFSSLTGLILVIFAPIFLNPEFTSKPQLIAIAIVGSFAGVRLFPWIFEKMGITLQEDKTLANQEIDDKLNENTDTKK